MGVILTHLRPSWDDPPSSREKTRGSLAWSPLTKTQEKVAAFRKALDTADGSEAQVVEEMPLDEFCGPIF